MNTIEKFQQEIILGIPQELPEMLPFEAGVNRAPALRTVLTDKAKRRMLLAALQYLPKHLHVDLAEEFAQELEDYGRIYMYRYRPSYKLYARPISQYPAKSQQAAAIMMMIQNSLDEQIAQYPYELKAQCRFGFLFENWAQYRLTMQYLSTMTDEQTLSLDVGHPVGLFPSHREASRLVMTNGVAGSFMYSGKQLVEHNLAMALMHKRRKLEYDDGRVPIFVSSGLRRTVGAQPKASTIAGMISIIAEKSERAIEKCMRRGWVDEIVEHPTAAIERALLAQKNNEVVAIAYRGKAVDLLEAIAKSELKVDVLADQTTTREHMDVVEYLMRSGALFLETDKPFFRYGISVKDISYADFFEYGFSPFCWVCTSCDPEDLAKSDAIALKVIQKIHKNAAEDVKQQIADQIQWIESVTDEELVEGCQMRVLYADAKMRVAISTAFKKAIDKGEIRAPIVVGRPDYDQDKSDAVVAIQHVLGCASRGATSMSLYGGYGMMIGDDCVGRDRFQDLVFWDACNELAEKSWACNPATLSAIERQMEANVQLKVTMPYCVDEEVISKYVGG